MSLAAPRELLVDSLPRHPMAGRGVDVLTVLANQHPELGAPVREATRRLPGSALALQRPRYPLASGTR